MIISNKFSFLSQPIDAFALQEYCFVQSNTYLHQPISLINLVFNTFKMNMKNILHKNIICISLKFNDIKFLKKTKNIFFYKMA